jgi:hypothetical protein
MGLFSAFKSWFKKSSQYNKSTGHLDLDQYDVAKLVDDLDLISEARRLGSAGIPAPDAVRPGGAEAEAIQRVDKIRLVYINRAALRLSIINESLSKADITQDINRALQADKEFERHASSLLSDKESVLRYTGDLARNLDDERMKFKLKHGLDRQAQYPKNTSQILNYSILFILIVVEGLLNSGFFAQGLDSGLIEGAFYAIILASINVFIAFVLGLWPVRFVYHKKIGWKLFGGLFIFITICIVIVVGLSIAHFRDALTSGSNNAAVDAMTTFFSTPFGLADLMSWGLFFLSVIFAIAAFLKGIYSDDLYPGYGKISRRAEDAIEAYEEELQALRNALDELRINELDLLECAAREAQSNVSRYATFIEDKRLAKHKLDTALQDAENSLNAVLLKFRQENEVARKGLPRPTYFDSLVELTPLPMPNFSTLEDEKCLVTQQKLASSLLAEIEQTRANIQAAFNQKFDLFKPLHQQFSTVEINP